MKYLFLVVLWLPFVLLTDLFPLMRFGMFAEPIKTQKQTEYFMVSLQHGNQEKIVSPNISGIPEQTFNYLARNCYYQDKAQILLHNISKSNFIPSNSILLLKKITVQTNTQRTDTLTVYRYTKP
jgi:hypothetical protein